MIDTITLKISGQDFVVYEPDQYFSKQKYQEFKGRFGVFGRYWTRYTDYPQQMKRQGIYYPQVTIIYRQDKKKGSGGQYQEKRELLIQVSIPKLLFGTNLFDIDERLVPIFAERLCEKLNKINIITEPEVILRSIVHRVDFAKILKIAPSYASTSRIIKELSYYDRKQSSAFNRSQYHEGKDGVYLKFYNSSQGFVVYDKFDEILLNGATNLDKEIASEYKCGKYKNGALRFELSIQKKQSLEAIMRQQNKTKKTNFTLLEVCRTDISKACLMKTFDSVYVDGFSGLIRLNGLKDNELIQLTHNKTDSLRERAVMYYLAKRVRAVGLNKTIDEVKQISSPSTMGRYKRVIENVLSETRLQKDSVDIISYLRRKLEKFDPILPKNLDEILN